MRTYLHKTRNNDLTNMTFNKVRLYQNKNNEMKIKNYNKDWFTFLILHTSI